MMQRLERETEGAGGRTREGAAVVGEGGREGDAGRIGKGRRKRERGRGTEAEGKGSEVRSDERDGAGEETGGESWAWVAWD